MTLKFPHAGLPVQTRELGGDAQVGALLPNIARAGTPASKQAIASAFFGKVGSWHFEGRYVDPTGRIWEISFMTNSPGYPTFYNAMRVNRDRDDLLDPSVSLFCDTRDRLVRAIDGVARSGS